MFKRWQTKSADKKAACVETKTSSLGLNILHDPAGASLDVVAVHGLNGSALKTWTHENGTLWLQDLLPKDVEHARIISFGYDASILTKAASQRTFIFAEELLSSLNDARLISDPRRPLFFVAHGLGGIVVKKALLLAQARQKIYKELLSSVHHLMFFGTPHQGATSTAEYLTRLGTALTRAKDGSVLKELQLWSGPILEANAMFVDLIESFTITTFFEKLSTFGVQVVDEGSARLNKTRESSVGVDRNHFEICKFSGADDYVYKKTLGRLRAEIAQIRSTEGERAHEELTRQRLELVPQVPDTQLICQLMP